MNKKLAIFFIVFGSAALLTGCSKKGVARNYSKYVELASYTGLTVDRYVPVVTDEEIQEWVDEDLSFAADYIGIVDRPAQNGDIVTVDYVGTIDGVAFEGGSEEDAQVELGAEEYIDGFEEAIVGMNIDEEKVFDITFPTPYDGELDGKTASFTVTLKAITELDMPEYDDAYVASISDYDTVEAYEASLREELQQEYLDDAMEIACEDLLATIIMDSEFKGYPDELFNECKASLEAEDAAMVEEFGAEDIYEIYGEDYDPDSYLEEMVDERIVVYTIASKEKIDVTDEEYQAALEEEMQYSDYLNVEEYESEFVTDKEEYLYYLLREKVLAFLAEKNNFNDVEEDEYYGDDDDDDDILDLGTLDLEELEALFEDEDFEIDSDDIIIEDEDTEEEDVE